MLDVSTEVRPSRRSNVDTRSFVERVRDFIGALGHPTVRVWTRTHGPHVLLGKGHDEAFARLTPLGGGQYGLAFRAMEAKADHTNAWEPLFLVDDLAGVVEHALVAVEAC